MAYRKNKSKIRKVYLQWRNFISGARRQDVVESPPPPLRFNVECFYSIVNRQIQRVRSAVNISSIWCFLPHNSLDPVAYRGFLAPGAKIGIGAPPFSMSDFQAQKRSLSLFQGGGGSGAEPQPPTLLGAFGCEWNLF